MPSIQALASSPSSSLLPHPSSPSSPPCASPTRLAPSASRQPWLGKPLSISRPNFSASSSHRFASLSTSRSFVVSPSCKVPTVNQDGFQKEVLDSDSPVLIGFCADWCGPCKLIGPVLESVAKEFNGALKVFKIETDSNPDLVKEYDVYGLPTLILFKDGREVPGSRREGTINAKKLKELLDKLLASVATT